jgi:hypothetical protein
MRLEVRGDGGAVCARRQAENIVLRGGAQLVAGLAAGVAGLKPINRVQVGFGTEVAAVEATALTGPSGSIPAEAVRAAVGPGAFSVDSSTAGVVKLVITTPFTPTVDLDAVSEAGLLADDTLYNQVVFEPITLRAGQEISLFWEIDFPYGH